MFKQVLQQLCSNHSLIKSTEALQTKNSKNVLKNVYLPLKLCFLILYVEIMISGMP